MVSLPCLPRLILRRRGGLRPARPPTAVRHGQGQGHAVQSVRLVRQSRVPLGRPPVPSPIVPARIRRIPYNKDTTMTRGHAPAPAVPRTPIAISPSDRARELSSLDGCGDGGMAPAPPPPHKNKIKNYPPRLVLT